jgi:hypothetical protein
MPVPKKLVFDSKLLPDGHLFCPEDFVAKKNLRFQVIVTEETKTDQEVTGNGIEYANMAAGNSKRSRYLLRFRKMMLLTPTTKNVLCCILSMMKRITMRYFRENF